MGTGMLGNLYLYGSSLLSHWWPLVSAGSLLGLEEFIQRYSPKLKEKLDKIPDKLRRNGRIAALLVASIYAGFLAWSDEHEELIKAQTKLIENPRLNIRQLTQNQRDRLRKNLELGVNETYSFQINTVPSCDECEQFAEELRAFMNSLPGWKTGGGPLMFPLPSPRRGLWIVSRHEDNLAVIGKLQKAFEDAGFSLPLSDDQVQPNTFVIIIGRKQT